MSSGLLDIVTQGLAPRTVGTQEFAESSDYCNRFLYPRQVVLLKLIFLEEMTGPEEDILDEWIAGGYRGTEIVISPDIRERRDWLREAGYKHFREVQLVGGRRSSKGFMTGICLAKVMFETLQLGDPREYYSIKSPNIYFSCIAGSESQAKEYQYGDFVFTVEGCKAFDPYLQKSLETEFNVATTADLRRMSANKARGGTIQRSQASLVGTALASNAGTLRGSTTMAAAQPLDAKVLTPDGWTTMGEVQVGDQIIGHDGCPVRVLKLHPWGLKSVFEVRFSDGSSTRCTEDHLWTLRQKRTKQHTKPLANFMFDLHKANGTQGLHAKWGLPAAPVVQYDSQPLPLDPYLIGALVGDGNYSRRHVDFYTVEPDIAERVRECLPEHHELIKDAEPLRYRLVNRQAHHNEVIRGLRLLGMMGQLGPNKHLPDIYKRAHPHERLALLQGLLDTDGSVCGTSVRFGVTSRQLALDVVEVVRSLGGYATLGIRANEGGFGGINNHSIHTVCISGLDATSLFRSQRKQARASVYGRYKQRHRRMTSVTPLGQQAVQCITVDSDEGLYLTDDFIITHNCIDEMAHMLPGESKAAADKVYEALKPSLDQFGQDGILFLNSSPYSKVGMFYDLYEQGLWGFDPLAPVDFASVLDKDDPDALNLNGDPRFMTFQFPSWALFQGYRKYRSRWKQRPRGKEWDKAVTVSPDWDPDEKDDEGDDVHSLKDKQNILAAKREEARNPEVYRVERRGQFAEVTDAYLNPFMVDRMYRGRPIGLQTMVDGTQQPTYEAFVTNFGSGASNAHRYKFHCDPSSTTAGFGFAIAHIEYFPSPQSGQNEEHVVFDMIKRWNPKDFPNRVIKWNPILDEITTYATIFQPYEVTFDQHQSAQPMQDLQERFNMRNIHCRVYEKTATNELNWKRAEVFKTALYQGLVHAPCDESIYNDPTCQTELKFLQEIKTGGKYPKVEKQDVGPVQTKDQADCAFECVYALIGNLILTNLKDRLSNSIVPGAQGGYALGFGGPFGSPRGPQGGEGPPGITDYYGSQHEKIVERGLDRASLTRSALGTRGRMRGARTRGRY